MEQFLTTKSAGDAAEARALDFLCARGLKLVERNYRVARGPSRPGGEIDLILRDPADSTLVFVEVRQRSRSDFGSAADSITPAKRHRVIHAARHYLNRLKVWPPCRFDVVCIDGDRIEWLQAAFDAG